MEQFIKDKQLGYNSLTNFDIYDIVKQIELPNFRGVYMKNKLSKQPHRNECGIMNFNTSNQSGSHWVCYFKNGSQRTYFDSFGCICPIELQRYLKTPVEFKNDIACIQRNSEQVQDPNTKICGQLCLFVLKGLSEGEDFQSVINNLT